MTGNSALPVPVDLDEETMKLARLQNNPYVPDADKRHVSFTPRRKAVFLSACPGRRCCDERPSAFVLHSAVRWPSAAVIC